MALSSLRNSVTCLFITMLTVYVLYSSKLILRKDEYPKCSLQTLDVSTKENLQTVVPPLANSSSDESKKQEQPPPVQPVITPYTPPEDDTELKHVFFGIAASSNLWEKGKEYKKLWWRPKKSHPLAKELENIQDGCIQRYPALYGSDDRIQACMAELGVPLTKEIGFHQYDVYGNLLGLLGAHPVTPVVSLHHLDVVNPIFPGKTRVQGLKNLFESVKLDSASIIQQSICYNEKQYWSISVSWGFVVQIIRGIISPRELEMPTRTFLNWYRRDGYTAYAFNTRPVSKHPGQKPFMYYMTTTKYDEKRRQVIGVYKHDKESHQHCTWKSDPPEKLDSIFVLKSPDSSR
ncbi:DUF604 domain-containing [Olea europaea subsp. europaea]|uniref:DUF604 domain-containing n=1 Tax=Olea europaea subsp. europaea TaxID=158383 RepID=A0A8S0SWZ4_OLEEU|nr:DUF604 domain-containing [Olea europaea subsp. europaea]